MPLGAESDGLLGVLLGGGVVAGGVDGMVVVGGDADGVRSPGRSPIRSVFDSETGRRSPTARFTIWLYPCMQ